MTPRFSVPRSDVSINTHVVPALGGALAGLMSSTGHGLLALGTRPEARALTHRAARRVHARAAVVASRTPAVQTRRQLARRSFVLVLLIKPHACIRSRMYSC